MHIVDMIELACGFRGQQLLLVLLEAQQDCRDGEWQSAVSRRWGVQAHPAMPS